MPSRRPASPAEAPPRAVLYDVDGTLYHLWPVRLWMMWRLARAAARHPVRTWREVRILRTYRRCQERLRRPSGDAPAAAGDQLRDAAEALALPTETVRAVVDRWMQREPLRAIRQWRRRGALEAIALVSERGLPQGVYSDYPAEEKLETLGVAGAMDVTIFSGQPGLGRYKPAPEGFALAARRLGIPAGAVVYVGDRDDVDGRGSRAAGMRYVNVRRLTARRVARARRAPSGWAEKLFGLEDNGPGHPATAPGREALRRRPDRSTTGPGGDQA